MENFNYSKFRGAICVPFCIFNNKINGNLPKSYYFLKGGIEIPEGEDLFSDKYKIPGNYYCPNNSRINTLKNCPVNRAFVLKVDLATGTGNLYPRQTFKTLENDIVSRTYDSYGEEWLYQKQVALKSDLTNVMKPMGTAGINANSVKNSGIYDVLQSNNTENYPTDDGNGILLVLAYNPNRIVQMFIYFEGTMWTRMYWHGTWRSWFKASNNA